MKVLQTAAFAAIAMIAAVPAFADPPSQPQQPSQPHQPLSPQPRPSTYNIEGMVGSARQGVAGFTAPEGYAATEGGDYVDMNIELAGEGSCTANCSNFGWKVNGKVGAWQNSHSGGATEESGVNAFAGGQSLVAGALSFTVSGAQGGNTSHD